MQTKSFSWENMRFMAQTISSKSTFRLQLTLAKAPLDAVGSHQLNCQNAARFLILMPFINAKTLSWQIYQNVPLSILHLMSFTDAVETNS